MKVITGKKEHEMWAREKRKEVKPEVEQILRSILSSYVGGGIVRIAQKIFPVI